MTDYNLNFSSYIKNKYQDKSTEVLKQILYENYKSAPHWQKKYLFNPYPNHTFDFEKNSKAIATVISKKESLLFKKKLLC